ncbi:MAG: hypothetical protein ACFFAO_04025 [Candidatus Hermodarchaeota archaeon]
MRLIKDLWIITKNGESVFYSNKNELMKSHFIAILMSTINSIANNISESDLSSVKFNDNIYNILIRNGLLFVANSKVEQKKRGILQELEAVSDFFFKKYGDDFIKIWDGKTEFCIDFENDLENLLPKDVQRIVNGFGWDL